MIISNMISRLTKNIRSQRSQAMVEFGFTFPLLLACFFYATSVGIYAVQRSAAQTGAEAGVRVASGGSNGLAGVDIVNPNLVGAQDTTKKRIAGALFATVIITANPGSVCPISPDAVRTLYGNNTVVICATATTPQCWPVAGGPPVATQPDGTCLPTTYLGTSSVSVNVIGYADNPIANIVGWSGAISTGASGVQAVTFQR